MASFDATDTSSGKKPNLLKKILLGAALLGLITLLGLGAVAYFFLDQITGNIETITQAAPIFSEKAISNQIAVIGNDDNVWLVSPDGQELNQITQDGNGYASPTWAPDGRYLAFVGLDADDNAALYVTPASKIEPAPIFSEAGSAPFYLYWSPSSRLITFLTQEASGLAMRQADTSAGTTRTLGTGSPFYWVWSPTGDKLLMHVGGARAVSEEAHLSLLENQQDAERIELDLAPGRFQAPVWSADGQFFYYIAADDGGRESIYRTDANSLEQKLVTRLGGFAYMVISPTGQHIAYLQIRRNRPPFGEAFIVDTDGQNHKAVTDGPVGSMYWSPDGKKLALLTVVRQDDGSTARAGGLAAPLPQEILFRWLIYNVETEEVEPLISFTPTPDFLQITPFFDQYHLSLTFWSPDSRYLVIPKENPDGDGGAIWVVDTTSQDQPRQIADGTLAVWSWK